MTDNLVSKVGSIGQDNLIADVFPPAYTTAVKIKAGEGKLKRGTVLGMNSAGTYQVYGKAVKKTAEFNGDGTTTTFTVSDKPAQLDAVKVGGTKLTDGFSYAAATGVITFTEAPAAGTKNVVAEWTENDTTSAAIGCVLTVDVDASGAADVVAVAYRSGCFNPDAIILAEGYTLTAADKDALRKYDIIFRQMFED